jgi:transposase
LLCDKGWSIKEIAEALLLSEGAIRQHIRDFQESRKIKSENGGSQEKLSLEQAQDLEKHLIIHSYLYVKDIQAYVKLNYSVKYTVAGMRNWLQRHRFTYKKPALVPGKANKEAQVEWISQYEKLKAGLSSSETIYFMDRVHPSHNTHISYGWIKKGVRKELASNSGRSRLNLSGAIDLVSRKLHIQEDKTLNANSTIGFFQKIENAYPTMNKVHVFADNAPYYKNKEVQKYLKTSKITLHHLHPYSPNLNPIERLWKWMKERVMYNTYYEDFYAFRNAILGFLQSVSKLDPKSILGQEYASRIRDRFRAIDGPAKAI